MYASWSIGIFSLLTVNVLADLPASVTSEVEAMKGSLQEMILSDPLLLKQSGLSPDAVKALRPDEARAFEMHRIDAARVDGAKSLADAVVSGRTYYVPLCAPGGGCPMMASYSIGEGNRAEFVSVGHPNASERIQAALASARGSADLAGAKLRVVEFPEAHANLLLASRGREETLIPQSLQDAANLEGLIDRPLERDAKGKPKIVLGDLKLAARRQKEQAAAEPALPEGRPWQPSDDAIEGKSSRSPALPGKEGERGAVLEINPPTAPKAPDDGTVPPSASAPAAAPAPDRAPAVLATPEATETSKRPIWAYAALVFVFAAAGWLLHTARARR